MSRMLLLLRLFHFMFFPHLPGEVRVVIDFMSAGPPRRRRPPPPPPAPPPDLNCKLSMAVFPAGLEQHQSVPRRTSAASARSQCFPLNPNWSNVFPAGPEEQPLDQSVSCRTSTARARSQCSYARCVCQTECHKIWHISGCFLADVAWQLFQPKDTDRGQRMQQACEIIPQDLKITLLSVTIQRTLRRDCDTEAEGQLMKS